METKPQFQYTFWLPEACQLAGDIFWMLLRVLFQSLRQQSTAVDDTLSESGNEADTQSATSDWLVRQESAYDR